MYPEQGHVTFSSLMSRPALIVEFLVLFLALPLAYRFSPVRIPALPLLWVVSGYGCWLFTIGLGQYFYHERALVTVSTLMRQ